MAFSAAELAHLQLASSKGDIYNPGSKSQVHNIIIHNTNTTTETVELLHHDGTNEYQLYKFDLAADETVQLSYPGEGWVIDASSKITGNTTTAAKVTFTAFGSEVT